MNQPQNPTATPDDQINQETLRRIEDDEILANQNGLFFTEPTLFALGSTLWDIGKKTYQASRTRHEMRHPVEDVAAGVKDLVGTQKRQDIEVDLPTMQMDPEDGLVTRGGRRLAISKLAVGQAVQRAGGPGGGAYLAGCPTGLRAHNFNYWMPLALQDSKDKSTNTVTQVPRKAVLRTMLETKKDGAGTKEVRGIYGVVGAGPRGYKPYDAPEAVETFLQELNLVGTGAKGEFQIHGPRWKFTVHFHSSFESDSVCIGDIFRGAIWLEGVDDGSGSLKVGVGVERARCKNLTTIWAKDVRGIRHTSKEIGTKLRPIIAGAYKAIEGFADKWSQAAQDNIVSGVTEGVEPEYIFQKLIDRNLVRAPGCSREDLRDRLVAAWRKEPGYTRAHISMAITRVAHEESWKSPWVAEDLEEQGGELLYNYLHLAPPPQQATAPTTGARFDNLEIN